MRDSHDTPETREAARARGYRLRDVLPSEKAQERYPLSEYPCSRCEKEGLPHLVDNGSEFCWEHQHDPPGSSARSGCSRFGRSALCGSRPRPGTATSLFRQKIDGRHVARTEEEYLQAQEAVEECGADDKQERLPWSWRVR